MDLLGPRPQDRIYKFIGKNLGPFNPNQTVRVEGGGAGGLSPQKKWANFFIFFVKSEKCIKSFYLITQLFVWSGV